MIDLTKAIEADSDCIVAADLTGGTKIIAITNVVEIGGKDKKKVDIHYEGMDGKPFRPCKSMLRVMCQLWETTDGQQFIGRGLELYREENCLYKGEKTPGVRICGMSHIAKPVTVLVQEKRGRGTQYEIRPLTPWSLVQEDAPSPDERLQRTLAGIAQATPEQLEQLEAKLNKRISEGQLEPAHATIWQAITTRATELAQQGATQTTLTTPAQEDPK